MALSDEILADLKKKGGGGKSPMPPMKGDAGPPDEGSADTGPDSYAGDEEAAMQEFMDATDATGKADALKAFLDICVPKIVDGMKG